MKPLQRTRQGTICAKCHQGRRRADFHQLPDGSTNVNCRYCVTLTRAWAIGRMQRRLRSFPAYPSLTARGSK